MATKYRIGTSTKIDVGRPEMADAWTYIVMGSHPGSDAPSPDWMWTSFRRNATQFDRDEAKHVAAKIATWMRLEGYPGVKLQIVPATGGMPIGAVFVS